MTAQLLTPENCKKIDHLLAKYPEEGKRSAVIPALHIAQDQNQGWLSAELMDAVADYLKLPKIQIYEVATFYDMYDLKPCGKHKIRVCTNISCMLRGSDAVIAHLEKRLNIKIGESTDNRKFSLKEAECLAGCCGAPMMQIDNKYYENLTPEKIDAALAEWKAK